jgi:hypothetical protein
MLAAETAADKAVSGYITLEEIALATTPTGTAYSWSIAKPSAATSRSDLDSTTDAGPAFTPDVEGYYTISCVVDSATTYIIRIAVALVASVSTLTTVRFIPVANASVPTPATGRTVYFSIESAALVEKRSDGTVHLLVTS